MWKGHNREKILNLNLVFGQAILARMRIAAGHIRRVFLISSTRRTKQDVVLVLLLMLLPVIASAKNSW